jgi:hypothetical protein
MSSNFLIAFSFSFKESIYIGVQSEEIGAHKNIRFHSSEEYSRSIVVAHSSIIGLLELQVIFQSLIVWYL